MFVTLDTARLSLIVGALNFDIVVAFVVDVVVASLVDVVVGCFTVDVVVASLVGVVIALLVVVVGCSTVDVVVASLEDVVVALLVDVVVEIVLKVDLPAAVKGKATVRMVFNKIDILFYLKIHNPYCIILFEKNI